MERPPMVRGYTLCKKTGCGKLYVTDNTEGEFKEVFLRLGKPGGCAAAFLQALARVSSFALRAGVPKERIVQACKGIGCPSPMWDGSVQHLSCPDAIAKALEYEDIKPDEEEERGNG